MKNDEKVLLDKINKIDVKKEEFNKENYQNKFEFEEEKEPKKFNFKFLVPIMISIALILCFQMTNFSSTGSNDLPGGSFVPPGGSTSGSGLDNKNNPLYDYWLTNEFGKNENIDSFESIKYTFIKNQLVSIYNRVKENAYDNNQSLKENDRLFMDALENEIILGKVDKTKIDLSELFLDNPSNGSNKPTDYFSIVYNTINEELQK